MRKAARTLRYARAWLTSPVSCAVEEISVEHEGAAIRATLLRPRRARGPLPAWVVLHGMTATGRMHAQLQRFARAVASSGSTVIVPEIPEWKELRLRPDRASATVDAGIRGLRESGWALDAPVGVAGFSFGAPHAITAAAEPELAERIGGVVGFGGYCDVRSTFRYMLTGSVEGESAPRTRAPDPYGRWIVGANYLPLVEELSGHRAVASALERLAAYSGTLVDPADDAYDPLITQLRAEMHPDHRPLFDRFATPVHRPTDARPEGPDPEEIADRLREAACAAEPSIDPVGRLAHVAVPVHVLHGRNDRLIPFPEAFKLWRTLPPEARGRLTITRLFGHSAGDRLPIGTTLAELPSFARALADVLSVV